MAWIQTIIRKKEKVSLMIPLLLALINSPLRNDDIKVVLGRRTRIAIGAALILVIVAITVLSLTSDESRNNGDENESSPPMAPTDGTVFEETISPSPSPTISDGPPMPGSEWAQFGQVLNGTVAGESFGSALSISGDGSTLAIAAIGVDDTWAFI